MILLAAALTGPIAWAQLYTSGPPRPTAGISASFSYRDDTGDLRTVDVFARIPGGVSGPLPVVVWSPAAGGNGAPEEVMSKWSEVTARAGYLSVSVAHREREAVDRAALCLAQGLDEPRECFLFDPVNWDWPNDLRQVITWLERVNEAGPAEIRGRIDIGRIAVAGFADGSSAAMSLAGAKRLLTTSDPDNADEFTDSRPVAFVALSPQGPVLEGFFDSDRGREATSWTPIARPVLTLTGAGDNNCRYIAAGCSEGDTPSRRRIPFELMPAGSKYEAFVDSTNISHDFIGTLDTAACAASGVPPAQCSNFDEWLQSAVLAFLDAHVRGLAAAQSWLRNGLIATGSGQAVIWSAK
jgi:hypothetical protein